MIKRRSINPAGSDQGNTLPLYHHHVASVKSPIDSRCGELPLYFTSTDNTEKVETKNSKRGYFLAVLVTILFYFMEYHSTHSMRISSHYHRILKGISHPERNEGGKINRVYEDDDNSNDDDWDDNWREKFLDNGLPLDHKVVLNPKDEYTLVQDSHAFVVPDLEELQMAPIRWAISGKPVDHDARLVGLPPSLTHELRSFCEVVGLNNWFRWAAHSSLLDFGETTTTAPIHRLKEGHKWAITRSSADDGNTNLHWLDAIDEASFEQTMDVLKKGHFDDILRIIAEEFQPWGYMVSGVSFAVSTHSLGSKIHKLNPGGGKDHLKLMVPIMLPERNVAQVYLGNQTEGSVGALDVSYHRGLLIGADTVHANADCDYRMDGSMWVYALIQIVDLRESNVQAYTSSHDGLFPFPRERDWLLAQMGRFWGGTYGGSFAFDRGRRPFEATDHLKNCPTLAELGQCEGFSSASKQKEGDLTPKVVRTSCPKSCKVYIDDAIYFSEVRPPFSISDSIADAYQRVMGWTLSNLSKISAKWNQPA